MAVLLLGVYPPERDPRKEFDHASDCDWDLLRALAETSDFDWNPLRVFDQVFDCDPFSFFF